MGTLLDPLKRKEIGNEQLLYYTQSTSLAERSMSMFWEKKIGQTISKAKQVTEQNYCSKCRGKRGN